MTLTQFFGVIGVAGLFAFLIIEACATYRFKVSRTGKFTWWASVAIGWAGTIGLMVADK